MSGQKKNDSDLSLSFTGSLFLFLAIIFISSAPVMIEQMDKSKRAASNLLARAGTWQIVNTSTDNTAEWESSDESSAEHVRSRSMNGGLEITLGVTQASTREAYFNKEAATTGIFKLRTEMSIPKDCHMGLVFRGDAQGEYYLFLVSASSYTVEILRRSSSNDLPREAIVENTTIPQVIGEPQTLTVLSDGRRYFFYINEAFVNSMSDTRLNGNRIGVEVFT
jgi:hypothetical protein